MKNLNFDNNVGSMSYPPQDYSGENIEGEKLDCFKKIDRLIAKDRNKRPKMTITKVKKLIKLIRGESERRPKYGKA